ncbi:MAG TPA: hypothetical protein VEP49_16970 [Acidimicrobiia bacterium]|nr:hypothetical protein [Acidimicrobiia bacterium]
MAPRRWAAVAVVVVGATAVVAGPSSQALAAIAGAGGAGVGTKAALGSPNCDQATGKIKLQFYGAPPCVRPWTDGSDNGGATAQGVTAKSIKVVVLVPPEDKDKSSTNGGIKNQATGMNGLSKDATLDENAVLAHSYQTWGRTVEYQFVEATGTDEASQRADAVTVKAMKPFAVFDTAQFAQGGGGPVFQQLIANAGVPGNVPPMSAGDLLKPMEVNMAEWAGKELVDGNAQFGGDDVKSKKRVFGVIYPGGSDGMDLGVFTKEFAKYGGKIAPGAAVSYSTPTDPAAQSAAFQDEATPLIAKLKQAGVTSIVDFAGAGLVANATGSFTKAATGQDYFPEWLVTGSPYNDLDFFARSFDQQQWAHAFGQVWFTPYVAGGASDALTALFQWYWGKNEGTHSPGIFSLVYRLYNGIMTAGPNLTRATFNTALAKFPASGGAFQNMITNLETGIPPAPIPLRGTALAWWNPKASGGSNQIGIPGTGKYAYLNGGKRYLTGKYPAKLQPFFDSSKSVLQFDAIPAQDQVGPYPCDNCPTTGGGQTPSASS